MTSCNTEDKMVFPRQAEVSYGLAYRNVTDVDKITQGARQLSLLLS